MRSSGKIIIAIDGPAASGKSTTARLVAKKLGYTYIDSGAMYRAVTLKALENNVPTTEAQAVAEIAKKADMRFEWKNGHLRFFLDGRDVTEAIRTHQINTHINPVAANTAVRKILVEKQRALGKNGGVVMDGRDIGSVVFPRAELKIFMEASPEERARRRVIELKQRGINVDYDDVYQEILTRDRADTTRSYGPLVKSPDAISIDTTNLSIEQQVNKIYALAMERLGN